MAHISISLQNSDGKGLKPVHNLGQVSVAVDYDGSTGRQIWVDAYNRSASGLTKKVRSLINIYDAKGVPVFSGDFDQLTAIIKRGKEAGPLARY